MSNTARHDPKVRDETAQHALRLIAYFDIFSHPLSVGELQRFIGPSETTDIPQTLKPLLQDQLIEQSGHFYHLPGRRSFVERRNARAWNAERVWPVARRAARILAKVPFVEGLMVTGALSKNSVASKDDIDFLVFTRPGRVWTSKTMLQFARSALPYNVRECFCTNYLVASDTLDLDDQTMFTAIELATAVPIYNGALCADFLRANAPWASRYVPGISWSIARAEALQDADATHTADALAPDWLEQKCLQFWNHYWNRKYGYLDDDTRAQRFKRTSDRATNHLHDFQDYVLDALKERCALLGVNVP